jgi:putative membrane protein
MSEATLGSQNLRPIVATILTVSGVAIAFLFWLLYGRPHPEGHAHTLTFLPAVNAALNGLAAVCITTGVFAIKRGNKRFHITCMITACVLSALFLVSYIVYHSLHGDTPFTSTGAIRTVYFTVLISHISMTIFTLPLIISAVVFAVTKRFALHRRVVKFTVPLWLYVSITGVAIFFLLKFNS